MRIMAASFKRPHAALHSVPPALQQATSNPHLCWRLLDPPGQVWVSLLWGHCSFPLDPGAHKVLFVPSQNLFPQSCVSSGGSMWVNGELLQEGLCHTQVCCTQSPCPFSGPLLIRNSTEDTQTLAGLAQTLWGPLVSTRFCLSPLSLSGGYGV